MAGAMVDPHGSGAQSRPHRRPQPDLRSEQFSRHDSRRRPFRPSIPAEAGRPQRDRPRAGALGGAGRPLPRRRGRRVRPRICRGPGRPPAAGIGVRELALPDPGHGDGPALRPAHADGGMGRQFRRRAGGSPRRSGRGTRHGAPDGEAAGRQAPGILVTALADMAGAGTWPASPGRSVPSPRTRCGWPATICCRKRRRAGR